MPLDDNWYTIDEASAKFGAPTDKIKLWVNTGLVRARVGMEETILVNGDDIELELHQIPLV